LTGKAASDIVYGGAGDDTIDVTVTLDAAAVDKGAAEIYGGAGDDVITVTLGAKSTGDTFTFSVFGGEGADEIDASADQYGATINGGAGNDTIIASDTTGQTLTGGAGKDTFVFTAGNFDATTEVTTITDFSADDLIKGVAAAFDFDDDVVQVGSAVTVDLDGDGNYDVILENVKLDTLTADNFAV